MTATFACKSAIFPRLRNDSLSLSAKTASIGPTPKENRGKFTYGRSDRVTDASVGAFPDDLGPAVECR